MSSPRGSDITDEQVDLSSEVDHLREELRLLRLELARAREEQEAAVEKQARLRRSKARAQREAEALASGLQTVLHERTYEAAHPRAWWPRRSRPVTKEEWEQVRLLRESKLFRPAWYLRRNLDVAREGVDPTLHFLRRGSAEGRDPGPNFDIAGYLSAHPELNSSVENPLIHHLRNSNKVARSRGSTNA